MDNANPKKILEKQRKTRHKIHYILGNMGKRFRKKDCSQSPIHNRLANGNESNEFLLACSMENGHKRPTAQSAHSTFPK